MNRSVRLSDSAEEDILRNAVWWADNHSIDEAIEWEAIVRRQLLEILFQPDSHSLLSESHELKYVIREALIGKGQKVVIVLYFLCPAIQSSFCVS